MSVDVKQFVEFGNILDNEKRKRLVEYIEKKINNERMDHSSYKDLSPYAELIDGMLSGHATANLLSEHPAIAKQVTSEILALFQRMRRDFDRDNPYAMEEQEFESWSKKDHGEILENIAQLFSSIKKIYDETKFGTRFYEKTATSELGILRKDKHKLDALIEALLNQWNRLLIEKKLKYELDLIEMKRAKFCKDLYDRVEKFRQLKEALLPFTNELGRLWDLSTGIWQKADLNVLTKYAEFLEKEQSIVDLAEMLGRMDSARRELEEEERNVKVFEMEWRVEHASKAELVGIHESDDLNNLLPSEIALLAERPTEAYFFKKFAEKKLMTFEYEAKILSEKEASTRQKQFAPKKQEKGPIILCIDTSGSMEGEPETVAKAAAFAIVRVALRDKRHCYLISFSTTIKTLRLDELRESLGKLMDFLGMSFYGGTDPEPALKEALRQIKEDDFRDADILVISDFIMDKLSPETSKSIQEAKKLKNRFHSLVISPNANKKVLPVFDNNWIYDLSDPKRIREVVVGLKAVTKGSVESP